MRFGGLASTHLRLGCGPLLGGFLLSGGASRCFFLLLLDARGFGFRRGRLLFSLEARGGLLFLLLNASGLGRGGLLGALALAPFGFRLDLRLRFRLAGRNRLLAVIVLQTLYILRVDGARRVREALLLGRGLSRVISGVEGALLGRRFFTGGRRRRVHVCFLAGDLFGLGNERRGA